MARQACLWSPPSMSPLIPVFSTSGTAEDCLPPKLLSSPASSAATLPLPLRAGLPGVLEPREWEWPKATRAACSRITMNTTPMVTTAKLTAQECAVWAL